MVIGIPRVLGFRIGFQFHRNGNITENTITREIYRCTGSDKYFEFLKSIVVMIDIELVVFLVSA